MDISIFLAKAFGIYLIVIGLPFIFNFQNLKPIINEFISSRPCMLLGAIVALILGIILILIHNIWTLDWRLLITLLAWLTFIKGVTRFYFPAFSTKMGNSLQSETSYRVMGLICLVLGIFLLYCGFM